MPVRRVLTAAAVAGAAALAVAVPAGLAQASSGIFIYHNEYGRQVLVDQPSDQCTQIQAQSFAGPVLNRTDSLALVYLTSDCNGPVQIVYPGQITELRLPIAGSVMFVND